MTRLAMPRALRLTAVAAICSCGLACGDRALRPAQYTVTMSSNPPVAGSTAGAGTYPAGATVTITATPAAGYDFLNWTVAGAQVSVSPSYTFTISSDLAVVANFVPHQSAPVAYRLHGWGFGPHVQGQDPSLGTVITEAQVRERMLLVAPYADWVRGYSSTAGVQYVGRVGHALGLKTACSAWLGRDASANDREVAGLIASANAGECDLLIVGSETLLRRDLTPVQLAEYITRVKAAVPARIPVSTADTYAQFLGETAKPVVAAVDLVLANYYPFWDGVALEDAMGALHVAYQKTVAAAGGKEVVVSEVGWPSCGATQVAAVPSPQNASDFFLDFVSWARSTGVRYFYFEALDEPWKAAYEGALGACWGIFDRYGTLKPGMQPVFDGVTVPDNWTGTAVVGGPGTPDITFTSVPAYGDTTELLRGEVQHVAPAGYRVAVYIRVAGLWWTKPSFADPTTWIAPSGRWTTDITTGGDDRHATQIAAYLVLGSYNPPLAAGAAALPAELNANALASRLVDRQP